MLAPWRGSGTFLEVEEEKKSKAFNAECESKGKSTTTSRNGYKKGT